jgi:hypothetical protein
MRGEWQGDPAGRTRVSGDAPTNRGHNRAVASQGVPTGPSWAVGGARWPRKGRASDTLGAGLSGDDN